MDLLERVRETGLLAPGAPVVVLLSGGRDSVCLLDVAVRLAGAEAVRALHVNYGLRDGAGGDEELCRALCARLGVELTLQRAQRPADSGNLQAWARDVRLGTGARLALERGAGLAMGHTASDQAETVLYRLAASPGRRALLGMSERDGRLLRPLLRFTRKETAAHCIARGLRWREDASNDDPAYARNRARAGSCRRCASCIRPRSATSCAPPSCCATRPPCSTRSSRPRSPAATTSRWRTSRHSRRRWRGSSYGASPRTPSAGCAPAHPGARPTSSRSATGRWTSATGRARWSAAGCCA